MKYFAFLALGIAACSSSNTAATPGSGTPIDTSPEAGTSTPEAGTDSVVTGPASCGDNGTGLSGASWSLAKSRFAFGGTPTQEGGPAGGSSYKGTDGIVVISAGGYAQGSLNGGVATADRPDFASDPEAMKAHVKTYLEGFGIPDCQVGTVELLGSFQGGGQVGGPTTTTPLASTIDLSRVVDGISVIGSQANAKIDDQDQSTGEVLYWPEIPADIVTAAKAFRDDLSDPTKLAAYKAKLPAGAQGDGQVAIHHSTGLSGPGTLVVKVTWETQLNGNSPVSYDQNGQAIDPTTLF